jgi:hypothetical protein
MLVKLAEKMCTPVPDTDHTNFDQPLPPLPEVAVGSIRKSVQLPIVDGPDNDTVGIIGRAGARTLTEGLLLFTDLQDNPVGHAAVTDPDTRLTESPTLTIEHTVATNTEADDQMHDEAADPRKFSTYEQLKLDK